MNTYNFKRNTFEELEKMFKREPNAVEFTAVFNIETCKIHFNTRLVALHNVIRANPINSFLASKMYFYVVEHDRYKELAKISSDYMGSLIFKNFRGTSVDDDNDNLISMYTVVKLEDRDEIHNLRADFYNKIDDYKNELIKKHNRKIKAINSVLGVHL